MKLIMICLFFSHFLKNTQKRRCGLSLSCPSLFADSARHPDLRIGCTFENEWQQGLWHGTLLCQNSFRPNIALLEFLVIATAVASRIPYVSHKNTAGLHTGESRDQYPQVLCITHTSELEHHLGQGLKIPNMNRKS